MFFFILAINTRSNFNFRFPRCTDVPGRNSVMGNSEFQPVVKSMAPPRIFRFRGCLDDFYFEVDRSSRWGVKLGPAKAPYLSDQCQIIKSKLSPTEKFINLFFIFPFSSIHKAYLSDYFHVPYFHRISILKPHHNLLNTLYIRRINLLPLLDKEKCGCHI